MTAATRSAIPFGAMLTLGILWLVWGTSWPAMRIVFLEIPVWQFRTVTCGVAGVILLAMGIAQDRRHWHPARTTWPRLVAAAFFNMTCWHILVGFGLQIVGAGHAAIVCYTLPIWTALLASVFLKERLSPRILVALVLGVAGVSVLLSVNMSLLENAPLGFIFLLTAAITWAAGTLIVKHYDWGIGMFALAGWQLLIGLVPIAIIATMSEPFMLHRVSTEAAVAGLYVLFVGMVVGYALWFGIVNVMSATVASIGSLMIPVIGVVSSAVLLDEPIGWRELVALVLVLSAITLVLFFRPKHQGNSW
ncbi:MAG: DMT family transporter [Rhodospirillaceae bacterium]|nr:DMT family transporter [Rhodospirillaceae bacterium]